MIRSIQLKFGSAPGQEPVKLDVTPVTVFVGPNNSGKSKVLQELYDYCRNGVRHPNNLILDSVELCNHPADQVPGIVNDITLQPRNNESVHPSHIYVGRNTHRNHVNAKMFASSLENPNANSQHYCEWYLRMYTRMLGGENRIGLVNEQGASDLLEPPTNFFQILFMDEEKRDEVRRIAHDAFGTYFVVDHSNLGKLRLRYSLVEQRKGQERNLDEDAIQFFREAQDIAHASDGVKAFTGIITNIIADDPKIVFIDDPEAFLHPILSMKLGREMAVAASSTNKRLFVSTHSPHFVMGCIQSGVPIDIVRLTYQRGVPTARTLPSEKLLRLMRNPLLRSTGVLEGLFYGSVIVTEADADRVFYQEINHRLLRSDPDRGVPDCLFLNAQNKQTIHQIVRPLRELGIPAAGIVDVDILEDKGTDWTNLLKSGFIPEVSHNGLGQARSDLRKKFEASTRKMKRDGGIAILTDDDKEAAQNLFNQLAEYGLFVVKTGELESWLKHLGATGHGPKWLIDIFEKMGENPDDPNYVKPDAGDVWAFLDLIGRWFRSPNRKGIPF